MKKFLVTYSPSSTTTEVIVEAENEDQALEYWANDKNIVSTKEIKHDDGNLDVEEEVQ